MISGVVYLLRIFKMFHGLMNNLVYKCFVNQISCTSIKSVFKIITVAVELIIYSEIKDMNSIKIWVCDLGRGRGFMVSNWVYSCLATLVFCGVTVNWLPGSVVMVKSCCVYSTRLLMTNSKSVRNM